MFNHQDHGYQVVWLSAQRIDVTQFTRCILVRPVGMASHPPSPHVDPLIRPNNAWCWLGFVEQNASRARCSCPRCPCCRTVEARRRGVMAHDCWGGCLIRRYILRDCDLFGGGQTPTRRNGEYVLAAANAVLGADRHIV